MTVGIGSRLGPYDVTGHLGAGGMGEVFRARDAKLGRDVAIKILPAAFTTDPERLARFEREARVLASLNHPHIAGIYGFEERDGLRALVLELVEGETLESRIRRGAIPVAEAIAIARQIADALDAAHERGIVHRDLKPANVAVTEDSTVKVLDFGLAKADAASVDAELTHSPTVIGVTSDGIMLGTAPYMSPEQARGKPVDKRCDIWAFGCVLYEMLAAHRAFGGDTTSDVIAAVLEREPDWAKLPPATPPRLIDLLHRCLEKDKRRRLRDIGDARTDLELPSSPAASEPARAVGRLWIAIAAAAAAAAIVTAGAMQWLGSRKEATASPLLAQTIASRLTNYGGTEAEAVISPDGRSFVFVSDHGGTPDIWLRQVSGGDPVRLTNDNADETNLAYTPDGDAIYFARFDPAGIAIWRMGALGGQAQKVMGVTSSPTAPGGGLANYSAPSVFALSPDGRRLAFYQGNSLSVSSVDGSDHRTVARNVLAFSGRPAWSPDGHFVSFIRGGLFAPSNLHVVDLRTGRERQITHFTHSIEGITTHTWLPDGRHVVVSYVPFTRQQAPNDLGILDVEDGSIARLTMTVGSALTLPSLSADGSRMLVTASTSVRELWKAPLGQDADANGRASVRLMDSSRSPMWTFVSRDGATLLFNSPSSGSRNLWTWSMGGSAAPRQITTIPNDAVAHSSLSPDGSRVAFVSNATGNADIWVQNLDGSELRQLTNDEPADSWPVWSPDGTSIVYSSLRGTQETWRVPAAGGSPEKMIDGFFRGDWIAMPQGGTRIVTSDGGAFVRLLDVERRAVIWNKQVATGGTLTTPMFSPDGRRVSLPLPEGRGRDVVWVLDAATGEGRIAVRFPNPMRIFFRASWVDGGAAVVVNGYRLETHIELFDRFWTTPAEGR